MVSNNENQSRSKVGFLLEVIEYHGEGIVASTVPTFHGSRDMIGKPIQLIGRLTIEMRESISSIIAL